jgi:hypothetical protein
MFPRRISDYSGGMKEKVRSCNHTFSKSKNGYRIYDMTITMITFLIMIAGLICGARFNVKYSAIPGFCFS